MFRPSNQFWKPLFRRSRETTSFYDSGSAPSLSKYRFYPFVVGLKIGECHKSYRLRAFHKGSTRTCSSRPRSDNACRSSNSRLCQGRIPSLWRHGEGVKVLPRPNTPNAVSYHRNTLGSGASQYQIECDLPVNPLWLNGPAVLMSL